MSFLFKAEVVVFWAALIYVLAGDAVGIVERWHLRRLAAKEKGT